MSWNSKIIWSEGLFLRPQHFQQQSRYIEWLVEARSHDLSPYPWGFSSLEIDEAALSLGKIVIRRATGLMPDGTPFDFPDTDEAPAALDFPPEARDTVVCLSLPMRRLSCPEISSDLHPNPLARYELRDLEIADSTTPDGGAETIQTGQPRFVLECENEVPDTKTKLGLVRVVERSSNGALTLDRTYLPPLLSCSASPHPKAMVEEILGLLKQRGEALAARLTQAGHGGVSEVADFLFLLVINRNQTVFDHLARLKPLHPERLYTEMIRLMGELAGLLTASRRPIDLPAYQHDDLQGSFEPPMYEIRRALSTILEQTAIQIELTDHKQGRYVAMIQDRGLLQQAGFVLAVNAQIPSETLRTHFPTQVKLGPVEKIRELVNLQLPGIALRPLPVAPRQIPFHAGFSYFELDNSGDLWRQLDASGGLGMYVSGDFPGLEVSLWAIRS